MLILNLLIYGRSNQFEFRKMPILYIDFLSQRYETIVFIFLGTSEISSSYLLTCYSTSFLVGQATRIVTFETVYNPPFFFLFYMNVMSLDDFLHWSLLLLLSY